MKEEWDKTKGLKKDPIDDKKGVKKDKKDQKEDKKDEKDKEEEKDEKPSHKMGPLKNEIEKEFK